MGSGGGKGRARSAGGSAGSGAGPTLELTLGEMLERPLPDNLPAEMFTGPGLLALADLLPVMTAYYDRDGRIQFINKLFADWLEMPRSELVGKTMAEVIGEAAWLDRKPMVERALAGERQLFVL
jgi:PAS domain-containing protein